MSQILPITHFLLAVLCRHFHGKCATAQNDAVMASFGFAYSGQWQAYQLPIPACFNGRKFEWKLDGL
jgi:hypothetical protein